MMLLRQTQPQIEEVDDFSNFSDFTIYSPYISLLDFTIPDSGSFQIILIMNSNLTRLPENLLLSNKYATPNKPATFQEFYTPFTPNIQKQLFTNKKNFSASKFYVDEQFEQGANVQDMQVEQALKRINSNTEDFSRFSLVTQDVVKLIYLFPEIKMLCTYPFERLFEFLDLCQKCFPNYICLVLSSNPLPKIQRANDITQLSTLKAGLVNITYSQLYRKDSETILYILKSLRIKQVFYLDDLQLCRYLLATDNIQQHIVCSNQVMPLSNSYQLKNFLQIRTDYLGPSLDIGLNLSEQYQPNFKLNQVIFLEFEAPGRVLMRLREQELEKVAVKFRSKSCMEAFHEVCITQDLNLKAISLIHDMSQLTHCVQVLVHYDQPYSLQEYLNDCAFLDKDCVSIVYLSKDRFLSRRKKLFCQQMDEELLSEILSYLASKQNECQISDLQRHFKLQGMDHILYMMEKAGLICIGQIVPQICEVSIDNLADTNSESVNELLRVLKLFSRRIISLRQELSSIKHFQINLNTVSTHLNRDQVDLCIQIENLRYIFKDPQFSSFKMLYSVPKPAEKERLEQCLMELRKMRSNQIEDLDIFFCLGQKLKSKSLMRCENYDKNQQFLAKLVDQCFTAETRQSIGQLFNHNHQKYLPFKQIEGTREKNQIVQDIRKLSQSISCRRELLARLMDEYKEIDPAQLNDLVSLRTRPTIQKDRIQGWMVSKKVKL